MYFGSLSPSFVYCLEYIPVTDNRLAIGVGVGVGALVVIVVVLVVCIVRRSRSQRIRRNDLKFAERSDYDRVVAGNTTGRGATATRVSPSDYFSSLRSLETRSTARDSLYPPTSNDVDGPRETRGDARLSDGYSTRLYSRTRSVAGRPRLDDEFDDDDVASSATASDSHLPVPASASGDVYASTAARFASFVIEDSAGNARHPSSSSSSKERQHPKSINPFRFIGRRPNGPSAVETVGKDNEVSISPPRGFRSNRFKVLSQFVAKHPHKTARSPQAKVVYENVAAAAGTANDGDDKYMRPGGDDVYQNVELTSRSTRSAGVDGDVDGDVCDTTLDIEPARLNDKQNRTADVADRSTSTRHNIYDNRLSLFPPTNDVIETVPRDTNWMSRGSIYPPSDYVLCSRPSGRDKPEISRGSIYPPSCSNISAEGRPRGARALNTLTRQSLFPLDK